MGNESVRHSFASDVAFDAAGRAPLTVDFRVGRRGIT